MVLRGRRHLLVALLAVATVAVGWASLRLRSDSPVPRGTLAVVVADVGQGDAIVVRAPSGLVSVVDGGPTPECAETVAAIVRALGATSVEDVVLTHPHADHVAGLIGILDRLPVRRVVDPGLAFPSAAYTDFLEAVRKKDILYVNPRAGDTLDWGPGVEVTVLAPSEVSSSAGANAASIVLRITHGKVAVVLAGDAPRRTPKPGHTWTLENRP